jgi:ribA/ribD-fused uncharacterized protein
MTDITGPDVRIYSPDQVVCFRRTKERFGGLSNMAHGFPLAVNGVRICASEVLYQACRFPHLPEVQALILREPGPMRAKAVSRTRQDRTRPDWAAVRVPIMQWCLRVKLAQHRLSFGSLLLSTGEYPIVEVSRHDDFWGAKPSGDHQLVGRNVLGRLLMELRARLVRDPDSLGKITLPPVPELLLLGRPPIM